MQKEDLDRVLVIARELDVAGRRQDAELLARLAAEAGEDFEPDLPDDELDRRLEEAEADIAAGRLTPNEVVWSHIRAGRQSAGSRS
ncbi:MAG: hypothetical protein ACRDJN_17350 [Chloroflexota bacterium]